MISSKQEGEYCVVKLSDEISIENSEEFKTIMSDALKNYEIEGVNLIIELETNIHIALIQIILAAKQTAEKLKKKISIYDMENTFESSLKELGIEEKFEIKNGAYGSSGGL